MALFAKYRFEVAALFAILLLFFPLRLFNILGLPIFTDEAIYLRWAQIAKSDAAWRFISLTDGKQPLFVWFTMVSLRFIEDPLLAGRVVSVVSGFLTAVGLFFLGSVLFRNRWIGIITVALYVIYPFALVYDRMALYDGLVGTFAVWSLYCTVLFVQRVRLDTALVLGLVMGGGVLNKTSGFLSIYLLPLSLILFNWESKGRIKRFLKWLGLALISVFIAYGMYSILRLSPFFHIIGQKNALFIYPFSEWVKHPFTFFWGNLTIGQWDWLRRYMTIPVLALIAGSFFVQREHLREKFLLFAWFLIPFFGLALFGRTLYPRFIFFMTLSLLPLAAYTMYRTKKILTNRNAYFAFVALILLLWLRSDYLILKDFQNAPIPQADIRQYLTDWPSGGGVTEAVTFFEKEAQQGKIVIGTEGTFGLMPYAFELYLVKNPNVRIIGFWPVEESIPKEFIEASKTTKTFAVFYQPCVLCPQVGEAPKTWSVSPVAQYKKPGDEKYLTIYAIHP